MLKALKSVKYLLLLIAVYLSGRSIPYKHFVETTGAVTLVDSAKHTYTVLIDNQTIEVEATAGPLPKPPATIIIAQPKTIFN
jgi:hypothetical protein